jgi:hypothetical protein
VSLSLFWRKTLFAFSCYGFVQKAVPNCIWYKTIYTVKINKSFWKILDMTRMGRIHPWYMKNLSLQILILSLLPLPDGLTCYDLSVDEVHHNLIAWISVFRQIQIMSISTYLNVLFVSCFPWFSFLLYPISDLNIYYACIIREGN